MTGNAAECHPCTPSAIWCGQEGSTPVIAVSVHGGHHVRPDLAARLALDDETRRREEDPCTDAWTDVSASRLVAHRSRFEVDLNRARDDAVYLSADDAWGLEVWTEPPTPEMIEASLAEYDAFYAVLEGMLRRAEARFGRFVVLDLHSYNHRRPGPDEPPEDPGHNPEVNVGTGPVDREVWGPMIDRFIDDLRGTPLPCGHPDVRENVRFRGGHLPTWVQETFPDSACVLAIEVKKFFMDEHSGAVDQDLVTAIGAALRSAVPGLIEELDIR